MTTRRLSAALLFLIAFLLVPCRTFALNKVSSGEAGQLVKRNISVAELGFTEGIHLGLSSGTQTFYFPISHDARVSNARLSFAYEEAGLSGEQRTLLVTAGNNTIITRVLPGARERDVVDVPLSAADLTGDFVKVSVQYLATSAKEHGVDSRRATDRLTVLPETALTLNVAADSLDRLSSVLDLLPPKLALGLPDRTLTEQEMAAAISAVRLFKSRGHQVTVVPLAQLLTAPARRGADWVRGDVVIATPADLVDRAPSDAQAQARVATLADGPGLILSGADLQAALNVLVSNWHSAAPGGVMHVANSQSAEHMERLTFDELGVTSSVPDDPNRAVWNANFTAKALPAGRWPSALHLDIDASGSDAQAVVNVFVNGRFLGGSTIAAHGTTHLNVKVPQGLVALDNQVRVVAQRQSDSGEHAAPTDGLSVHLLGSSSIELGDNTPQDHDFFTLAPLTRSGLSVYVRDDLAGAAQRTALQVLGTVANNLSSTDAPITVKRIAGDAAPTPDAAFLAWGDLRFAGSTPPVRIDRGNVIVRTISGTPLLNLKQAGNTLVAQVIALPGTARGVSLRVIGAQRDMQDNRQDNAQIDTQAPQTIDLDRGNVAFVDADGVKLALSTERDTQIKVTYPEITPWQTVARRYGTWVVFGSWVIFTIVVLVALRRIYRRDRHVPQVHKEA
jgi:hypothetical protein